jgi:hypothetical protein
VSFGYEIGSLKRASSFGGSANRSGMGVLRLGPDVAQPANPPMANAAVQTVTHRPIMATPQLFLRAAGQ